ncbi:hypothetical protein [Phytohabitans suffuscus]|uniref:Uncharacterized protein n=1 Tax=Phytohabitans suffuscus TaxID=624315 RepID=A0A6F8YHF0_9ACTN|nr:hypothetical protein [Phytohabitans suffuscus]BCB85516.1 hypothetical protein Psuf_028290 [Phytohabitans suffuscus]
MRDLGERIDATIHIAYEIKMCGVAAYGLNSAMENSLVANVYLESLLIHARVLGEFLYTPKRRPDDLRPEDFDGPLWTVPTGEAADRVRTFLRDTGQMINKHMAHLTWARVESEQPKWPYFQILQGLTEAVRSWCDHLKTHDPEVAFAVEAAVIELEILSNDCGPYADLTYAS